MKRQVNWVIVCITEENGKSYAPHLCAYENKPDEATIEALIDELSIDEEFGMTELVCGKDYTMSLVKRSDERFTSLFEHCGVPLEF